jgi:hypothetical protein
MKPVRKSHFIAFGLLITTIAAWPSIATAEVNQCTEITSLPFTITTSGTWCMKQDLTNPTPAGGPATPLDGAIQVQSDNVTIDLNGHTLLNDSPGEAAEMNGITAFYRTNIIVRNGQIRGFKHGILLGGITSSRHLVEDIRADDISQFGIYVIGANSVIRNNIVTNTGPSDFGDEAAGIVVVFAENGIIENNMVANVTETRSAIGIGATAGARLRINGNSVFDVDDATEKSGIMVFSIQNAEVGDNHLINQDAAGSTAIIDKGFSSAVGCFGNRASNFATLQAGCDTVSGNRSY